MMTLDKAIKIYYCIDKPEENSVGIIVFENTGDFIIIFPVEMENDIISRKKYKL